MTRTNLSTRTRFEVLKRDGFTCQYCGRSPGEDGVKLHVDHVIAVAEGGTDAPVNLVAACAECNIGKSDKPLTACAFLPRVTPRFVEQEVCPRCSGPMHPGLWVCDECLATGEFSVEIAEEVVAWDQIAEAAGF